ncbi:hypothetical protein ACP4OV_013631 [Aristida adscensionis]
MAAAAFASSSPPQPTLRPVAPRHTHPPRWTPLQRPHCALLRRWPRRRVAPAAAFCSAPPLPRLGRVGLPRREGSAWLLSFGADTAAPATAAAADDSSQELSALLPLVVAATAVASLWNPASFSWVSKDFYAPALGGIMLSIGIKLSPNDFALAFKRPVPLSIGYAAQYVIKPLLGVLVAKVAQLSTYASFLSKGDVALSILLTSCSTVSSVVVTPILTGLLIGSVVPIDGIAMSKSILQVVLVPVTLGLLLNTYAKGLVTVIQPAMPFVAMACTSMCIGSPLAINRSKILSSEGLYLLVPVVVFHVVSFVVGYWISKLPQLRQEEPICRTISLCTGMQSSTLAGLLATQFLGTSQAVPAACSVVIMAIFGLTLASFWGSGSRIRDVAIGCFPQDTHEFET